MEKKIKVGWFTFTCCEDNTIIMTEVMNDHWQEWKKILDFRHARVLRTKNVFDEFDIAFVEGAISSDGQRDKLKAIREKSKVLVAVGACAVVGMPSAQRNNFNEEQNQNIQFLLERFKYLPKVLKVADVVKVDVQIPGCPMDADDFLNKLNALIKQFKK